MTKFKFETTYKTGTNTYKEVRNPWTNRTTYYFNGKCVSGHDKYIVQNALLNAEIDSYQDIITVRIDY
jgi:hypothetical protein